MGRPGCDGRDSKRRPMMVVILVLCNTRALYAPASDTHSVTAAEYGPLGTFLPSSSSSSSLEAGLRSQ